ncbi:MAG: choice-of-anchor Q domain-containing protein [Bacteroidota bacterium]|nr:choice-of-anchor Q domain-containing protein [Bacteroidota bacterium]
MKHILLYLTVLMPVLIHSQVITVKQDGSGDYSSIQQAIDAAADADTVLVWPGTYQENIDYAGKNITVGSLNLTTGEQQYISQTIIDGNQNGSCVKVHSGENNAILHGFTLINGSGTNTSSSHFAGGGVYLFDSYCSVINCILKDNRVATGGGGILCNTATVFISGSTIKNNHAMVVGGGICVISGGTVLFDTEYLSNLYLNYAERGNDFHKTIECQTQHIYVDTFTVLNPDEHFISSIDELGYQNGDVTFTANHGKTSPVDQDVYVSPQGSDENDGLSPGEPLKTIAFALNKILPDSSGPLNTIHVGNGTYSPSITGEKYPLNMRGYIRIEGEEQDSTILDAEDISYIFRGNNVTKNYSIKNFTFSNGNGNLSFSTGFMRMYKNNDNVTLDNITFLNGKGNIASALNVNNCNNALFQNLVFKENNGGKAFRMGSGILGIEPFPFEKDTNYIYNCSFLLNTNTDPDPYQGVGGGLHIDGLISTPDSLTCYIINCEFSENNNISYPPYKTSVALGVTDGSEVYLVNSTIGNNSTTNPYGAAIGLTYHSSLAIYNSILYSDDPREIYIASDEQWEDCSLEIYNSLIEGGESGIKVYHPEWHTLYYDSTNIDADPLWANTGYYPYMLSYGSPCINTGTLDLPEHIELPETDLAGNPRVYDGQIDMGAYEYGPWVGVDYRKPKAKGQQLKASPNPFHHETRIRYQSKEKGKQSIFVYDINGNDVATLMDITGQPGQGEIIWDGRNDYGRMLPAGVYVVEFVVNDESRGSVKVVKK